MTTTLQKVLTFVLLLSILSACSPSITPVPISTAQPSLTPRPTEKPTAEGTPTPLVSKVRTPSSTPHLTARSTITSTPTKPSDRIWNEIPIDTIDLLNVLDPLGVVLEHTGFVYCGRTDEMQCLMAILEKSLSSPYPTEIFIELTQHDTPEDANEFSLNRKGKLLGEGFSILQSQGMKKFPKETWILQKGGKIVELGSVYGRYEFVISMHNNLIGKGGDLKFSDLNKAVEIVLMLTKRQFEKFEIVIPASEKMGCLTFPFTVESSSVASFQWSEDSRNIYFKFENSPNIWMVEFYNLTTSGLPSLIPSTTPVATKVPLPLAVPQEQISISPSKSQIFYYTETRMGQMPTSPTGGELSGPFPKLVNNLYIFNEKTKQNQYLGEIQGQIEKVSWANDERIILIQMNNKAPVPESEAVLWMVEINKPSINLVVPRAVDNHQIFILSIAPDGSKVLYYDIESIELRIKYTGNNADEDLLIAQPGFIWWLPDNNSFIYLKMNNLDSSSVFKYDIPSKKSTRLSEAEIDYQPFALNSVQLAPDYHGIAYIEQNTNALKYVPLCIQ
jgi:hypothetical protein